MQKFPNLFPDDPFRIVQRSKLIYDEKKWREVLQRTGERRTASGVYIFVTIEGDIFVRRASTQIGNTLISHIDLALGKDVDYAGTLYFSARSNRGILRKWTNESGHYRPSLERKSCAGLPEELFQPGQFL
jgi:hypothetical protein